MLQNKKNNLKNSAIISKIILGSQFKKVDPTNFKFILGTRQSLFFLINPLLFNSHLKTGLQFFSWLLSSNFKLFFIVNFNNFVLFQKFKVICQKNNWIILDEHEIGPGILTNRNNEKIALITLFLSHDKAEFVRKEVSLCDIPTLSFSSLDQNKTGSFVFVGGNYTSFFSKNLIISFLMLCIYSQKEKNNQKK